MGFLRRTPRGPSREERSIARAVPATATVVTAGFAVSSQRTDTSAPYTVVLDVVVGGQPPVRREVTWTVYTVAIADVQPGQRLEVTVDPMIPDLVYPPGFPPPSYKPNLVRLEDCRILPTASWLDALLHSIDE